MPSTPPFPGRRVAPLLLLLALGAAAFTRGAATWPLVSFPMYSYVDPSHPRTILLEGITAAGQSFPLSRDAYFRPYLRHDILYRFARLGPAERVAFLQLVLRVYEAGRHSARHKGPALRGIRVSSLDLTTRERRVLLEEPAP